MIKRIIVLAAFATVVLVGVYAVLTLYDKNMVYWRMWETPAVKPHEEPITPMADGVVPFSGGEAIIRETAVEDLKPPFSAVDDDIIEAGKTAYGYYCAQCHGKNYDGMGTVGQSFEPLPTDLRSQVVQEMTPAAMFRTISYGKPDGRQPPLHATITPAERWKIIAFVRSLKE